MVPRICLSNWRFYTVSYMYLDQWEFILKCTFYFSVEAESYNLRTCSEVYDDNNSYCYNKAACPIPFVSPAFHLHFACLCSDNEDVSTKQTQITSAGIMNSSDVPRRGIEER